MRYIFFLIGIIPFLFSPAFADTSYRGYNYQDVTHSDGVTHSWTGGLPPRILYNGSYDHPYVKTETANTIKVETGTGSFIYDKNTCSINFFKGGYIDGNSASEITGDTFQMYGAAMNTSNWIELTSVNNAVCQTQVIEDGNNIEVHGIKDVPNVGKVVYKWIKDMDAPLKVELEITNQNPLWNNHKVGIKQTIQVPNNIKVGDTSYILSNYNGTHISRSWLQTHLKDLNGVIKLDKVSYDFGLGWQYIESVDILYKNSKSYLILNYFNNNLKILPGQTLIIDPTYTPTVSEDRTAIDDDNDGACEDTGAGSYSLDNGANLYSFWQASAGVQDCYKMYTEFDITTIPDTATVTDVDWNPTVNTVSSTEIHDIFMYTATQLSLDGVASSVFGKLDDGTKVINDQSIATTGTKNYDLGSSGDTVLTAQIQAGNNWVDITMELDPSVTQGAGQKGAILDSSSGAIPATLSITYITARPPYAVTSLTSTSITNTAVALDWTAPYAGGGGQYIIGYQINKTTPWGTPTVYVNDTGNTNTDYNVSGLVFGTQYSFRVTAWTNNTNGHPFSNSTGNIYNVTTTSTTYSGVAPSNLVATSNSATQINLQWTASTMQGLNGYRVQRETPIGTGWSTIVSNTTNTNIYYNNTGLTSNIIYNYRVYGMNGSGLSGPSNEYDMTTFHKPNAVTDLTGVPTTFSTMDLSWSAPISYAPEITGYMINYTAPIGDPLTIFVPSTGNTDTTATVTNLIIGQEYSFRVSAITVHGRNATGNIFNGTTSNTFTIGNLTSPYRVNTNDFKIFFERDDINSTALYLNVTYPNTYVLDCNFQYKFSRINDTYTGLSSTPVDADNVESSFQFINVNNEVIHVRCWDTLTDDESRYVITITDFPLLQQLDNFTNGTYGTYGQFGAIDMITLVSVILGMIGFNRINAGAGVFFTIAIIGALAYFGIVGLPTIIFTGLALVILLAITTTRKDD